MVSFANKDMEDILGKIPHLILFSRPYLLNSCLHNNDSMIPKDYSTQPYDPNNDNHPVTGENINGVLGF